MAPKAPATDADPALFITVRYAYEQETMFAVDCPCAMLLARIVKKCSFKFPDMPEIVKYDLKGTEDGEVVGILELGLERANEHLTSRKIYDFVGFDCDEAEYPLCQEEPIPEPEPDDAEGEAEEQPSGE